MPTTQFDNVTATAKANIYFAGKVISHSLTTANGEKKTLGLIFPGDFNFDTAAPELMEITDGHCRVKCEGQDDWTPYVTGQSFNVPGNSRFEITIEEGICQYICSFLEG